MFAMKPMKSHVHFSVPEISGGESPIVTPQFPGARLEVRNTFIDVRADDDHEDELSFGANNRFTHRRVRSCPNSVKLGVSMSEESDSNPARLEFMLLDEQMRLDQIPNEELELHMASLNAKEAALVAKEAQARAAAARAYAEQLRLQLEERLAHAQSLRLRWEQRQIHVEMKRRAEKDDMSKGLLQEAFEEAARIAYSLRPEKSHSDSPLKVEQRDLSSSVSTLERWPDHSDLNAPWRIEEDDLATEPVHTGEVGQPNLTSCGWNSSCDHHDMLKEDEFEERNCVAPEPALTKFELCLETRHDPLPETVSVDDLAHCIACDDQPMAVSIARDEPSTLNDEDVDGVGAAEIPSLENFTKPKRRRGLRLRQQRNRLDTDETIAVDTKISLPNYTSEATLAPCVQELQTERILNRSTPPGLPLTCVSDKVATVEAETMIDEPEVLLNSSAAAEEKSRESEPRSRRSDRRKSKRNRLWCHVYINEDVLKVQEFDFIPKLIGTNGKNTRDIWKKTDTKVRVRGRGSGHCEVTGREASAHFMVALAAEHGREDDFRMAVAMVKKLLEEVFQPFREFCRQRGLRHDHDAWFWMGEIPQESNDCLAGLTFPSAPQKAGSIRPRRR